MRVENISFKSDGINIVGKLYVPVNEPKPKPTICVCHGIPSPVKTEGDRGYPALAEKFVEEGFVTLIFNFRGTGFSEGKFNYFGWTQDLYSALDFLCSRREVDGEKLAVVGFSGGAVVSIYVAAKDKRVKAVALGACPAYTKETMKEFVKVIVESGRMGSLRGKTETYATKKVYEDVLKLMPTKWIGKISPRPVLIVHGEKDELVNVDDAFRLYSKAKEPKKIVIIPDAQHKLRLNKKAVETFIDWLKEKLNS